eukprot:CAMPEP_0116031864 /NCGR_PEP_ID=MMETSP0321-20121206/17811_1 /TAXON_ID=163516 /ORGANISM="Leptocylindrus danicus var. danicus, Strain B650" /LENGTH=430 /DNA_ID=CAMNT_0003507157 /DNA_START=3 /DNA_END=1291 /DNA_ORIENTATION=-
MPPKAPQTENSTATKATSSSVGGKLALELNAHQKYFDDLVNRIPAHLYITSTTEDADDEAYERSSNKKYYKGQHKESRQAKKARLKEQKAVKYEHPDSMETTVDVQRREAGDVGAPPLPTRRADTDADVNANKKAVDKEKGTSSEQTEVEIDTTGKSRIEILREKLHAKIAAKQGKASIGLAAALNNADAKVSKRAARRAEKQRRIEEAKQRNANTLGGASSKHSSKTKMEISDETPTTQVEPIVEEDPTLSQIDYGTITGLREDKNWMSANKSLKNQNKKKSLEKLMEEAEKKKKRLDDLKQKARQGDEEAAEKAAKIQWSDTLQSATGEKMHIKNDPNLIKKAIKRKQKQKEKSAAKWASRLETKAGKMNEKQSIRNHNISQRRVGGASGANLSKKRIQDKEGKEVVQGEEPKKKRRLGPHAMKNRAG